MYNVAPFVNLTQELVSWGGKNPNW